MSDDDEFFELVGCHTERCVNILTIIIRDQDGNIFLEPIEYVCGLVINDHAEHNLKCQKCEKFLLPCDCRNGVRMPELTGSDDMICSNDYFCKRNTVSADQIESHDEDFTDGVV